MAKRKRNSNCDTLSESCIKTRLFNFIGLLNNPHLEKCFLHEQTFDDFIVFCSNDFGRWKFESAQDPIIEDLLYMMLNLHKRNKPIKCPKTPLLYDDSSSPLNTEELKLLNEKEKLDLIQKLLVYGIINAADKTSVEDNLDKDSAMLINFMKAECDDIIKIESYLGLTFVSMEDIVLVDKIWNQGIQHYVDVCSLPLMKSCKKMIERIMKDLGK